MTGVVAALGAMGSLSTLDTQTVTSGASGTVGIRVRGYRSSPVLGSIVDGTSNIYGGAAITELCWDESSSSYLLTITGATNSGWTQLVIDGSKTLTRASASTFSSGSWSWGTADTVATQIFGAAASVHTCVFS